MKLDTPKRVNKVVAGDGEVAKGDAKVVKSDG